MLEHKKFVNPSFSDAKVDFFPDGKLQYDGIEAEFVETLCDGHTILRIFQSGDKLDDDRLIQPVVKRLKAYVDNGPITTEYSGYAHPEGLKYAILYDGYVTAGVLGHFYDTGDDSVSRTVKLGNQKTNEQIMNFVTDLVDKLKKEKDEIDNYESDHGLWADCAFGKIYLKSDVSDDDIDEFMKALPGYWYNNYTIKKRLPDENGFKVIEVSPDIDEFMANHYPGDDEIANYSQFCYNCEVASEKSEIPFFGFFCMPVGYEWDDFNEKFCIGAWYKGEEYFKTEITSRDELSKADEILKKAFSQFDL